MIIKIAFDNKKHLYRGQLNLKKVRKHCQSVFTTLPKHYEFYYFDNDGDEITVSSQQDLDIILEDDQSNSIKKLFIKEVDCQFQVLSDEGNPENQILSEVNYSKVPKYQKQIKTINIVKECLSVRQQDEIKKQASLFLNQIQNCVISKILDQENQLIKNQVKNFVQLDLQNKIINKVIQQQEKVLKLQVQNFLNIIIDSCSSKISQQKIRQQKKFQAQTKIINKNQELINRIVQQKINKLIPGIIKQVSRVVEARLIIEGCFKCQRRQSIHEMQNLIASSLRKGKVRNYHEI